MFKSLFSIIGKTFLSLVLLTGITKADEISLVSIPVIADNFSSGDMEGIAVELKLNGETVNYAQTNSLGNADFNYVEAGLSYSLIIKPSYGPSETCPACPVLEDLTVDNLLISRSSGSYDSGSDHVTLSPITLEEAAHQITITVVDQNNTPVQGVNVGAYNLANNDYYVNATTGADGIAKIRAVTGRVEVYTYSNNTTSGNAYVLVSGSSSNSQLTIQVKSANANITVGLKNSEGQNYILPENYYASVQCYNVIDYENLDPNEEPEFIYFYKDLNTGESSTTVPVVGGYTYECSAYVYSYESGAAASTKTEVSVENGQSTNATITILNKNFSLSVGFVDDNGNPIILDNVDVFAYADQNTGIEDYAQSSTANGEGKYVLNLVENATYEVTFYIQPSSSEVSGAYSASSTDTKYLSQIQYETVVTSGSSGNLNFELQAADATFTVTLTKSGVGVEYAWIDIVAEIADETVSAKNLDSDIYAFYGMTNSQGVVEIPVLSGLKYNIFSWMPYSEDGTTLNPAAQRVKAEKGDNPISLEALIADFDLTLNLKVGGSSITPDWAYCSFDGPATGFGDLDSGSGIIKIANSTESYNIRCDAGLLSGDDYLYYVGEANYTTPSGSSTGSADINMDNEGEFYPTESYTVNAGSAQTITLPDGCSKLIAPAGSFANNGNVTINIGTNTDPVPSNENIEPFSLFDITAFESDGTQITTLVKPVKLVLCYDESLVGDESELSCVGSNEEGSGLQALSCEVDTDENTVTFTVSHFSDYGLNISGNAGGSNLESPTSLKAKKEKNERDSNTNVKLTWPRVQDATNYKIKITRTYGKKNRKKEKISYKTVKAKASGSKQNKVLKLKNKGTYQFAIATVKDDETSDFTSANRSIKVK